MKKTEVVNFPYYSFRNVTCPDDAGNDRKVLMGQAPITSFLELNSNANVREYLLGAEGKAVKRSTAVHRQVKSCLKNTPDKFSVLNGGIVIVAEDIRINDGDKSVDLVNASIINGSQTQGIIKEFCEEYISFDEEIPLIYASYEIIVTKDSSLVAEISIARNYQNAVKALSIAGSLGQLNELNEKLQAASNDPRFKKDLKGKKLKKSETDFGDDYLETERIIQVLVALTPDELWIDTAKGKPNKVKAYTSKARCLKDFQSVYKIAKGEELPPRNQSLQEYQKLYDFYLDIVPEAFILHEKWKHHEGWTGKRLKKGMKRENGIVTEVADGIMFPILASLSVFARKMDGVGWTVMPPPHFPEQELIDIAKEVFMEIAKSDPPSMGKNQACYSVLKRHAENFRRYAMSE
jgi:hypothetical protein